MTPTHTENATGTAFTVLNDKVRDKDSEERKVLYCNPYAPQQLYVKNFESFNESFTRKTQPNAN